VLVVNDTRFEVDRVNIRTDCYDPTNAPIGIWPTKAELDTFLFAVGGNPWKCYPPRGAEPLSTPGIFNGYDYDTLGTNLHLPDLTVRLSKRGPYGHVVWLTDPGGARYNQDGLSVKPMTSMRYMNDNRKSNTLAAYVRQGGQVWLAGGGAATASIINF